MYSNDEPIYLDKRTERGNRDNEEPLETEELDDQALYNYSTENRAVGKREEDWSAQYQHKHKELTRDQQIRVSSLTPPI